MKHIFRKSLALLLTMAMLLGMFTGLVAVQTTTASAADAEVIEVVTADEFWDALEKATASRKPTVIKLMANVSAIDTITDHSPYPHLQWAVNYPKAIVPNNCQIDLNGKILTIRGIVTAAQFLPKADTLIDATGKGSVKVYIWNAVAASTANGIAMANRSKFVTTLQITTAINQKNADYVIPSGVTLTGTAGVTGSRSLTFKSGAICSTAIVRGTNGVIFECATEDDFLRTNLDKATVIRLMADLRVGDVTIGKNQTLDLNGHTLKCHTLTMNGKLTEKGGKVITGVDPYDLTPNVEAPANEPVADPMPEPANAKHYYVLDYIQSDGIDDYIDTGIVPTRYMRTDMDAEMANLVEGAIFGSTYTQSSVIADNGKSMYYSVGLNADGSFYYRYNVYTSWKFNRTGLEFTGKENKRTSGDTADPYVFPEHTRGFFRANYWLTNVSSSNTKITAEMIPYGSTESHQVDVKTSTGNVNTFFGKYNVTMYLFANHEVNIATKTEETNRFAPARLYSMQVYDSNGNGAYSIRASFLPVINENGETGLLDLVSGEFFGNNGSGVFKRGPVLGEIAVGDENALWFTVSSGAESKVRAAAVSSLASKVRLGNPEKPVLLSDQYPELADTSRWSYPAMSAAVRNELMKGDSKGKLNLTGNLTRAEAATIITRAFGATESADVSHFSDAVAGQWYIAPMSRAVYMGVMNGADGKLLPNSPITREQVFTILARALNLPAYSAEYLDKFADGKAVSDWAKESVAAMVEMGFVNGSDGKLLPKNYITREQFAQVMYNLFKTYIQSGELYVGAADGGVMVNTYGVTLKDVNTKLVVVGDGAANGDVTLDDVTADTLIVRGGGLNTVYLKNSSAKKLIIAKPDGGIRVKADSTTKFDDVEIDVHGISGAAPKGEVIFEGTTDTLNVTSNVNVLLQNASVQQLNADLNAQITKGSNAYIAKSSTYVEPASVEPEKPASSGGSGGETKPHVHNLVETGRTEPTCEARGTIVRYCGSCNTSFTEYLPALGHDYEGAETVLLGSDLVQYCKRDCGNYKVIRAATAEEIFTAEAEKTELLIGEATQIAVANADKEPVTEATFVSKNEAVATVDATGKITAVAAGKADIVVTVNDLPTYVTVNVLQPAIDGKTSETLSVIGDTVTFAITNEPLNVTWASSDEKVATVKDGVVTAVANGKATITAAGLTWTVTVDAPIEVKTLSDLVTAVNLPTTDGYNTKVVLTEDLTDTADMLARIVVPNGKTLDLSGRKVTLEGLRAESGAAIVTDDTTELVFLVSDKAAYLDAVEDGYKLKKDCTVVLNANLDMSAVAVSSTGDTKTVDAAAARWTYAATKYAGYLSGTSLWLWAGAPANVTIDLNGHTLTARAFNTGFGSVVDGSEAQNGKLTLYAWNGVQATVPRSAAILNETANKAPNKQITYTNSILGPNSNYTSVMTIPEDAVVTVNSGFTITLDAGGGYVFKSGATLKPVAPATFAVTAPAGVVFECATLEDLTRDGIKYATQIKLVADIDAPELALDVPGFDCNGFTLRCKSLTGPDAETFKTGDGGKVITESGEYTPADRPVELSATALSLNAGKTAQLELAYAKEAAAWTSDNEAVATVDQTGLVTGVAVGSATITVTYRDQMLTCKVTVNPNNATVVTTEKELKQALLDKNAYVTLGADITSTGPITLVSGQTLCLGTSTLTANVTVEKGATLNLDSGKVNGTVEYMSPTISATAITLEEDGETYQLSVSNADDLTLAWSSDNTAVATVEQTGKVTAVANGTATITVNVDGEDQTCTVTVAVPDPVFTESAITLIEANEEHTLTLLNKGLKTFTWSSDNTAVATVDQTGKVTAVANGTANITAAWGTGDTQKTTCVVTVSIVAATDVATKAELDEALAGSNNAIKLTEDIDYDDVLTIPAGKTLYLGDQNLYVTGLVNNGNAIVKNTGKLWANVSAVATVTAAVSAADVSNIWAADEVLLAADSAFDGMKLTADIDTTAQSPTTAYNDGSREAYLPNMLAADAFSTTSKYGVVKIPAGKTLDLNGKTLILRAARGTLGAGTVEKNSGRLLLWFNATSGQATTLANAVSIANELPGVVSKITQTSGNNINYTSYPIPSGVELTISSGTTAGTITFLVGSEADFTRAGTQLANKLLLANDIEAPTASFAVPAGTTFDCNGHVLTCAAFACAAADYVENGGYVYVNGELFDPNKAPITSASALTDALNGTETEIKLAADINYNAVLTIPEGKTLDLNGNNLYVNGLVNNGTLTKNSGKLMGNVTVTDKVAPAGISIADVTNVWSAFEVLNTPDTELDGIIIRTAMNTASMACTNANLTRLPNLAASSEHLPNSSGNHYFLPIVPEGKTLDLNGMNLSFMAAGETMGSGEIIDSAGTAGRIRLFYSANADGRGKYERAVAVANERPTQKIFNMTQTADTIDYADYPALPTNAFILSSAAAAVANNVTFAVAEEGDLNESRNKSTSATLRANIHVTGYQLVDDLVLTQDIDIGAANMDLNGHTVTGGKITTTGEIYDSTLAVPELDITAKTLTAKDETFTLTLSNATATGWTSDNTAVATVENGVVTAVANGTATITVTYEGGSLTCEVTVAIPAAPELDITEKTLTAAGETVTLTLSNATATGWTSDNTAVATVADGVVTAVANGTATITVTYEGGSLTCEVTVAIPATPELDITEKTLTAAGETVTLTLSNATATGWTSDNTAVATVADGVVTAVANGTATITVTYEGGSLTCTVTVDIPNVPATEVATKAELDAAFTNGDKGVKLTADIDYNAALTIPTGTTLDLNGNDLYVTGLVNNGTLTKNEGKLWANASKVEKITEASMLDNWSNIFAAYEALVGGEPLLDGVKWVGSDSISANVFAVANLAARSTFMPNAVAAGAFNKISSQHYLAFVIPAGKTLDLNGKTLKILPATTTLGEGTITGATVTLYPRSLTGEDNPLENAMALIEAYPNLVNRIYFTVAAELTADYIIPSGTTVGANKGILSGTIVYAVANEADLSATRINTGNAKPTDLKLTADIVLTADVDVGAKNVNYDNHTVTGGKIITTGTETNKPTAPATPELDITEKTLTAAGETVTLTLSNATATGWTSDNTEVATVENGVVTAVANGTATITVTYEGGSLSCTVTVDIPVVTPTATEVATKAELDEAITNGDEAIKLTEDINYNAVLTVPAGTTIDFDGNNLYVTGLVNNGTLEKNSGKLWANVSASSVAPANISIAAMNGNLWASWEVLLAADTELDGVRLTANLNSAAMTATAKNLTRVPNMVACNAHKANASNNYYFLPQLPAGKTLDLNGYNVTYYAITDSIGEGDVINSKPGNGRIRLMYNDSDNRGTFENALAIANSRPNDKLVQFVQSTGDVDYTGYLIPANAILGVSNTTATNLTFEVVDASGFTRTGTADAKASNISFLLNADIELTEDIDIGSKDINYNGHTVTGGEIITTGTVTGKP